MSALLLTTLVIAKRRGYIRPHAALPAAGGPASVRERALGADRSRRIIFGLRYGIFTRPRPAPISACSPGHRPFIYRELSRTSSGRVSERC